VAPAPAPARDHDITVEDYFTLSTLWQVASAPDGRHVAWSELRWEEGHPSRNADLWIAATGGGQPRRLTFDHALDAEPRFTPDGRALLFASTRKAPGAPALAKGHKQIWRMALDGSGKQALTREAEGVEAWQLSADGRWLYYTTARDHQDQDGFAALRKAHAKLSYGRGVRRWSTLWRLDLTRWRREQVAALQGYVPAFALSPEGGRVALFLVPSRRLIDNEGWSKVALLDLTATRDPAKPALHLLDDRRWRAEAPSPYGWLEHPTFSDDGGLLAFTVGFDGYPAETIAVELRGVAAVATQRLPRYAEFSAEGPVQIRPGTRDVCTRGTLAARDGVFCVAKVRGGGAGAPWRLTDLPSGSVSAFAFSADGGSLALLQSDLDHPPDVFTMPAKGGRAATRLTRQNPQVDRWRLPQIRAVRWKSADGREVEGILELPPGHKPGDAPLPLVVELHGGPTSATRLELRYWIYGRTLFAARGWALLSPNYRGSTGYGDRFLTELIGHKNDRDVADIRSGVDQLIADGLVDPKRMAVMGWSNGGYLTNCLIAADQRFAAASSGAGVVDTTMQWMIEDTPGHVVNYNRGLPWQAADAMRRSSPLYRLGAVRTPTLIHVGERDERVPAQHSQALFRALDQYLKVPTQLVVYPGAGHGLVTRAHREAKLRWDLAWFERYVPGFKATAAGGGGGGGAGGQDGKSGNGEGTR
jgi:dipeptidyl aminopeptidase/acylaminoacyl peptidase